MPPNDLLAQACQQLTAAHLHPMTNDRAAILYLSGRKIPIAGRFVDVAGTAAAVDNLAEILSDLGLPPKFFAPVAWGIFDSLE